MTRKEKKKEMENYESSKPIQMHPCLGDNSHWLNKRKKKQNKHDEIAMNSRAFLTL